MGVEAMGSGMRALRLVCCCLFSCVLVVAGLAASAVAAPVSALGGGGLTGSPLVVPGAQELLGGQQLIDQRQAALSNPVAVDERLASRTGFEHLDAQAAIKLAGEAFPRIVHHPDGGAPSLPGDEHLDSYLTPNAARISLPGAQHGVIESLEPIAASTGHGLQGIDLTLKQDGHGYVPTFNDVAVQIPSRLSAGVGVTSDGVTLTPVDASGRPLESVGTLDGASVLYANTQTDTDTVVKPTTAGVQVDALLRSVASPKQLSFEVGMPAGAQLVDDPSLRGARVVFAGKTIAIVSAPSAQDADGTTVPLSTHVAGNTLVVDVENAASEYRYPIEVDPNAFDTTLEAPTGGATNWHFVPENGKYASYNTGYGVVMVDRGNYKYGDTDSLAYKAYGQSSVISIEEESQAGVSPVSGVVTKLEIAHGLTQENERVLAGAGSSYGQTYSSLCVPKEGTTCGVGVIGTENTLLFSQTVTAPGENTEAYGFWGELNKATVGVRQVEGPISSFNKTEGNLTYDGGRQNVLYGSGGWLSAHNGGFEIITKDPGLGVSYAKVRITSAGVWSFSESLLEKNLCSGVWCQQEFRAHFNYEGGMEEGENKLEVCAENAAHMSSQCQKAVVYVDNAAPSKITLKGLAETGAELSATPHQFTAEATDGAGGLPSSGIKSIAAFVDGHEIGGPNGSCAPGECTASGSWTINGENLGAGEHKLAIRATDNANNVLEKSYTFAIRNAAAKRVGPATVDLITGQLALNASDVDVAGVGGVSRGYLSRSLSAGIEGPLGPQWNLSVGAGQIINVLPNGNVELRSATGSATTFSAKGGGTFTSPTGDENWVLEAKEKEVGKGITEYVLTNPTGNATERFTLPTGSKVWVLKKTEGAAPSEKTEYGYQTAEIGTEHPVTEPTEVLGPVPAGVTCGKNPAEVKLTELKAGCRALTFAYAASTTAKGNNTSEWGEYKGRLSTVSFTAYNPTSKVMQTTAVAQYSYDSSGRLRTEWDPRISPPLKTTYGYDEEGHVSSTAVAGQEPWLIHYGGISGEESPGRVLSVTRPLASVALGNGNLPVNTGSPTLSTTTPTVGTTMSVSSNGTWSNSPLAYNYQWERCQTIYTCLPIAGAVNQSYTPQPKDAGYFFTVQVIALNATGAVTARTLPSGVVPLATPTFSKNVSGALISPQSDAIAPSGNIWVPNYGKSRVDEFSSSGTFIETIGWGVQNGLSEFQICTSNCTNGLTGSGHGEFNHPWGAVVDPKTGNLYVSTMSDGRIQEFNEKGEFTRTFSSHGTLPGELGAPTGLALDSNGNLWVADPEDDRLVEFTSGGQYMTQFGSQGTNVGFMAAPYSVAITGGNLYVAEYGNSRVQEFTTQGTFVRSWGTKGSGSGEFEFETPAGIGADPVTGDLFVTDCSKGRTSVYTQLGGYVTKFGSQGTGNGQFSCPVDVGFDSGGNAYVADSNNNRVEKWTPTYSTNNPLPAAPSAGSNSIYTIDYRVPVSGEGAPYQMTTSELATWGQTTDLPSEATAVFPPDQPMGWPAKSYTRAAITYMDAQARTVNTTNPSRGIATIEYNALNEVTRTLTAVNRATALKEGAKSAEVAKALSTEKIYNSEGSDLIEIIGPEHKIAVAGGGEEGTRDREKFSYNENKPSGEANNLVTKSESWSETASKKALERRVVKTSYAGPNNVGWKLRKPTLKTVEIKGQTTASATTYNESSGNVVESSVSVSTGAPFYTAQFGSSGTGNGQLKAPSGAAIDSHGNLWVLDKANNRVEEFTALGQFIAAYGGEGTGALQFKAPEGIAVNQTTGNVYISDSGNNRIEVLSSEGKFVVTYGFGVGNGETKFQTCVASCRAGLSGSGGGQFNAPIGVVVDNSANVWVVDRGNSRLEKFSSGNAYLAKFGTSGTGELQFKEPNCITIDTSNLYVTDSGNARVEELSLAGSYVGQFGSAGTGNGQFGKPAGITANPNTGRLYVVDPTNSRVEEFTEGGGYSSQFGTVGSGAGQLKEPTGLAADGLGDVYVVDGGNARIESWEKPSPAPVFASQFANGDFARPTGAAVDGKGNLWVANSYGNNVQEFSPSGARIGTFVEWGGGAGKTKEPVGVAVNRVSGSIYVADVHNYRIDILNEKGEFTGAFGYGVGNGEEKLQVCTTTCREGLIGSHTGEFNRADAVSTDVSGNIWVTDEGNQRVQEFNSKDEFIRTFGFGVSDGKSEFQICTSNCLAGLYGGGAGQFANPAGLAVAGTHVYVSDSEKNRVEMFTTEGAYVGQFGSVGSGNGQFNDPTAITVDVAGNLYIVDTGNSRIDEFTASGAFVRVVGNKGSGNSQVKEPEGIASDLSGDLYLVDSANNRLERWQLAPNPGNEGAGDTKTTYYSAAANAEYPACGNRPEWANLVCQTEPVVQPGDSGPPQLPVVTTTYNVWDAPETIVENRGGVLRTIKKTFDSAGRETLSEETTTATPPEDTSLPSVSFEYSSETGALIKQSETLESKLKTLTSEYNKLGQLTSYTDAGGSTTTYAYDVDGRVEEVSEPKGRQVYSYDLTTGYRTRLFDVVAGTFTASYDVAGGLTSENYPNGMTAKYTRNAIGRTTNLEYEKTTNCSEKCVWFADSEAFGPGGQIARQTSTLASGSYLYNEAGELTETQETPTGGKCVSRTYGYNEEDGLRENTTTHEECGVGGGIVEGHFYDAVGRLIDPEVSYDALGNVTKLPGTDAGGSAITSSYYVDSQVATQVQGEKSVEYSYDPGGRTFISKLKSGAVTTTATDHYAGAGGSVTWACEEVGGCKEEHESKWTRNIAGIDGSLGAVQTNGEAPVLQIHDLNGNIVGTASLSESASGLLSTHNVTEYGVSNQYVARFAWLGSGGVESEFENGVITSAGQTYVPQIAETLQAEAPIPPGSTGSNAMLNQTTLTSSDFEAINAGAERTLAQQRALETEATCGPSGEYCGESEIDPLGCVGKGGLNESQELDKRHTYPYLNIKCHHARPDAELRLCLQEKTGSHFKTIMCSQGGWDEIGRYANSGEFAIEIWGGYECKAGVSYRLAFGGFAFPMAKPLWEYGKVEGCKPDLQETSERAIREAAEKAPTEVPE